MNKKALIVASMAGFIDGFLREDIKNLQEMGYEVHCAASSKNITKDMLSEKFDDIDAVFHEIDFLWNSPLSKQSITAYKQIKRLLKSNKYDVVHCHTPIVGVLVRIATKKYRRKNRCKVLYTSHGFSFYKGSSKKNWVVFYPIEKILSMITDAIITINHEDYDNANKMFCKKVYHINGMGCDVSRFANISLDRNKYRKELGVKEDELMILSLGRVSKIKNQKTIVKALAQINNPKLVFVICGKYDREPNVYEELKELAKEKNVRVLFMGHRLDIPEICHCADIGVQPSIKEGLGLGAIEMMASGVPMITSNIQGIKDYMKNDVNGYMCAPYDIESYVDAIEELSNKEKRLSMKEECIKTAKEYDVSIRIEQMRNIYSNVLTEGD